VENWSLASTPEEVPRLKQLHERGVANGVERMRWRDRDEFREIEPYCDGICALLVPSTGIVNYTEVAHKYAELIERAGGEIVFHAMVVGLRDDSDANVVETTAGAFRASRVTNCAGCTATPSPAWRVAGSIWRSCPSAASITR
jgi:L-2-hydroxyglutarate oxidase